jgi:5'-nucleotidase
LIKILVTNDDGIDSTGIHALADAMRKMGDVFVIAPAEEMSAISHALTLNAPLSYKKMDNRHYKIFGTPSDCVYLGIVNIMEDRPDLVVSGINSGSNMGDDITYSGTVAAAIEGTILGVPSIAFSLSGNPPTHFDEAASWCREIAKSVLENKLPKPTLLNVNLPDGNIKGYRMTRLGVRRYSQNVDEIRDPRGKTYYWIGGERAEWDHIEGSDYVAVNEGYISITPLHLDLTDYKSLKEIEHWNFKNPDD